ncbi:HD domain-containing phosphohydrolase [Aliamphritea hakodatensis]|uniref:HD domain-containing phosphohydrolase n=1 Tax=Aliamphritea hakodatensis TaxID=2895352 RepID=UPI0022FD82F3|nr:HD domain-containing phosphohydrolase [Aliamphritea hakodatensis]
MATFSLGGSLDNELFAEAYDEFLEQYRLCESSIVDLEHSPEDAALLDDLFRTVHTVKANSSMLSFAPMVIILQELENVLDLVREGQIPFSDRAGDLVLLLMDKARDFMEQYHSAQQVEYDDALYEAVKAGLQRLSMAPPEMVAPLLVNIIALVDPNTRQVPLEEKHWLDTFTEPSADLSFLYNMAQACEQRVGYWQGRTDRVVKLALAVNEAGGSPVDANALAASLFTHDIAMAFLPTSLLTKQSSLDDHQTKLMRQHVQVSAHLMRSMFDSQNAGTMLMQHQELLSGSGYPKGLSGNQICTGAKIIAIVHTFEAITHGHTSTSLHKRPLMRALLEISNKAGVDFDKQWVEIFMKVVREQQQ